MCCSKPLCDRTAVRFGHFNPTAKPDLPANTLDSVGIVAATSVYILDSSGGLFSKHFEKWTLTLPRSFHSIRDPTIQQSRIRSRLGYQARSISARDYSSRQRWDLVESPDELGRPKSRQRQTQRLPMTTIWFSRFSGNWAFDVATLLGVKLAQSITGLFCCDVFGLRYRAAWIRFVLARQSYSGSIGEATNYL
jgi:hypothetical protein